MLMLRDLHHVPFDIRFGLKEQTALTFEELQSVRALNRRALL